jgi:hypothetical protein
MKLIYLDKIYKILNYVKLSMANIVCLVVEDPASHACLLF